MNTGINVALANLEAWDDFAAANTEALIAEYGDLNKALLHVMGGGLVLGGGPAPLVHVYFVDHRTF